jgi:glutamyl-tRNA reductase
MSGKLVIFTANHRTVSLEEREGLSLLSRKNLIADLQALVSGIVAIETCNRIELIFSVDEKDSLTQLENRLQELFTGQFQSGQFQSGQAQSGQLLASFSRLVGDSAVRHLFRVVCGLESQVIGEAQIAGQIKQAYYKALEAHQTDTLLNRAFHRAFNVSKLIRTKSQIGRGSVSIASLGAKLCEQVVGNIAERKVLVIGAGELGELTLKHLSERGLKELSVINRTAEKSFELAKKFGGKSFSWEKLREEIAVADIIISTIQGQFKIQREDFPLKAPNEAKVVVDLSFPRSIHPDIGALNEIYLYTIEDLKQLSEQNLSERKESGKIAEELLEEEVWKFLSDDSHEELGVFSTWAEGEISREESRIKRQLMRRGLGAEELALIQKELQSGLRALASRLLHTKRTEIRANSRKKVKK